MKALANDGPSVTEFPDEPGLYALYGSAEVWRELGLTPPPDARPPLYVGKAEDSLHTRDGRTHFGEGKTGWSTLRRSLAALLPEYTPVHRSAAQDNPTHYALGKDDDLRLTQWMRANLAIRTWTKAGDVDLAELEGELIQRWKPPLNLKGHGGGELQKMIKEARQKMAARLRTKP